MEIPNFCYIDELADGCDDFKNEIIKVLKKELPLEFKQYQDYFQRKNLIEAAEVVHKLKHKISLLGLEKGYYIAEDFESNLKNNNQILHKEFEEIIKSMLDFVNEL